MDNIIIFGAGNIGKAVYLEKLVERAGENGDIFYYDNDTSKQGTYLNNILILPYEQFIEKIKSGKYGIILAGDCWKELFHDCQKLKTDEKIIGIYNRFNFSSDSYGKQVYGQEAEELYLQEKFEMKYGNVYKGFYVDVGAHHPYRFSNTQWAYKRGWRGINIEPNSELIELFNQARQRDININCGIDKEDGIIKYYKFDEPACNTFDENEFRGLRNPREISDIPVRTLKSILCEYGVEKIDFINIDVEGLEMRVLQSMDWEKYRPDIILVEQKDILINELLESDIYQYLSQLGYVCEWKTSRTAIYKLLSSKNIEK